jgi:hypothetical protein
MLVYLTTISTFPGQVNKINLKIYNYEHLSIFLHLHKNIIYTGVAG